MAIQRAFALLTVSATQRHPAYSHVPQRLARPWHFSKTIKNRLKWEKMISHFKRLRFSNFAAGYTEKVIEDAFNTSIENLQKNIEKVDFFEASLS